jgi:hypothetical protein
MASWMVRVRFVGLKTATPSATAARTTASATIAEDARRFRTTGSRGVPGCEVSACSAIAAAAARSMCGVTREALETITPRPRPGTTVESHLQRAYEKLGISGRHELAGALPHQATADHRAGQ